MASTTANAPENTLNLSDEQTLEMLSTRAAAASDRFNIRIFRATGATGLGASFAMFANATIEQIAQAEPWLSRLGGSGQYSIAACHMDEPTKRIGGILKFKISGGEQRPINMLAPQHPEWEGPLLMTYPPVVQPNAPGNLPPLPNRGGYTWDGSQVAVQPFQQSVPPPGVPNDTLFMREQTALAAHTARERELAAREAAMSKQMTEREEALKRSELEQRLRAENDRTRAEAAAHAKSLEEKINLLISQPKKDDGASLDKVIAAVAAAVTPIVSAMMTASAEGRIAAQKQASEAAAQHNTLLMSLLQKPTGLPPEVTMLFEMQKNQGQGNAEMMNRIVDAMGAVSKTSVAMIEAVADMNLGGAPENPMIQMVREGVKAVSMLANGAKDGAKKQIAQQQQQQNRPLPNGQPQQQVPVQQFNGAAPGSQATPQQQGHGAVATGPQQPAQPQHQQTSISEPPRNSVEELERLIRARYEPIENVANFFVQSVKTDEMKAALTEHEGDIGDLLQERLGDWIDESTQNFSYIQRLAQAVEIAGTAAGIYAPPDADGDDSAEQGA